MGLIWRGIRYFFWKITQKVWWVLYARGIRLPIMNKAFHPVDRKIIGQMSGENESGLVAICDFSLLPMSFDTFNFLIVADEMRRRENFEWLDVIFVADHQDPLQDGLDETFPIKAKDYRVFVHNLGLETTKLLPNCRNVHFFTSRRDFVSFWELNLKKQNIYPAQYSPYHPDYEITPGQAPGYSPVHIFGPENNDAHLAQRIVPPDKYVEQARRWLEGVAGGRVVVTLTLRETPYTPDRNSNIAEWQKLVDHHDHGKVLFVVLRDFFSVFAPPVISGENVVECSEAVLNVCFRAAIYQEADFNMHMNGGAAVVCFFNPLTRYVTFNVGQEATSSRVEDVKFQWGVDQNQNLPGAGPFQKWVWEQDDFAVLERELTAFLTSKEN